MTKTRPIARLMALLALAGLLALSACNGDKRGPTSGGPEGGVEPPPGGVNGFSYTPIDLALAGTITPLGNLNPPGHTTPSDHAYMYAVDFDRFSPPPDTLVRDVYAPALGAVNFMLLQPSHDWKVQFVMTKEMSYYLDHIQPRAGLKVGDIVQAGEIIGTTNRGGGLDLGAWDTRVTLTGILAPGRYSDQTLHAVTPWRYYDEPLRSLIYSRVRRASGAAERDARIDFGIAGRLSGDWYHASLPHDRTSAGPTGWPKTLAFVRDYYDPTWVRVAIGGTIAPPGIWTIPDDAPRPEEVAMASGLVRYRLLYTQSKDQSNLMLVRMFAPESIRVEVFPGATADAADFDGNAQIYVR